MSSRAEEERGEGDEREKDGKSGEEEIEREKREDEIEGWWRRMTCPSICLTLAARSSRPLIEWKGQTVDRGGAGR